MIKSAYEQLFEKPCNYSTKLTYSGKFSDYNANVRYNSKMIHMNLSREWEEHGEDLQIGIIQHLLAKMFKSKKRTWQMDVYEKFLQRVGDRKHITKVDETLKEYFDEINNKYFAGMLDNTNLCWGTESLGILGKYEYGSNTITISTIMKERPDLLAYVMYHEMLHKKLKFEHKGNRTFHHTKKFREEEAKFDLVNAEKELEKFIRSKKRKFSFW